MSIFICRRIWGLIVILARFLVWNIQLWSISYSNWNTMKSSPKVESVLLHQGGLSPNVLNFSICANCKLMAEQIHQS